MNMILQNWIISQIEPPHMAVAKRRVWESVAEAARPNILEIFLRDLTWFFGTPIRTAIFSVILFFLVLGGGYYVPTRISENNLNKEMLVMQSDLETLELDLSQPISLEQ